MRSAANQQHAGPGGENEEFPRVDHAATYQLWVPFGVQDVNMKGSGKY